MIRTVVFHILCPGQLQGQRHTALGLEQLAATADQYLRGANLDAVFCSDMFNAKEAVEHVLQIRDENLNPVLQEALFVREYLSGAIGAEMVHLQEIIGEYGTAEDWLGHFSYGQAIADSILNGITAIANDLVSKNSTRRQPWHVLVGYHAPFTGFGALDPSRIGSIGAADIVQYTLRHNGGAWRLISTVHLPCPLANRSTS